MSIPPLTLPAPHPSPSACPLPPAGIWLGGNYNIHDNDSNGTVEADYGSQYIILRAN